VNDRDTPQLPPACEDCGHRASLHRPDGCCALLLGVRSAASRVCGCPTALAEILTGRSPQPPAELLERQRVG
jgi:hypothetical protein